MGVFDGIASWLLSDPSQAGGGLLARALGLNANNPGLNTPTVPAPSIGYGPFGIGGGGPLFGNSPLMQGIRGGLTGLAGSNGYSGAGALGAGFVSAEDQAQKRRQWDLANRLGGLDLYRQQMLLSGPPGMGGNPTGAPGPGVVPSVDPRIVGPAGGLIPTIPKSGLDPTAQGGQSESAFMMGPNGYGSSQLPAPVPNQTPQPQASGSTGGAPAGYGLLSGQANGASGNPPPAAGGGDAAFKAATGYDSPADMFRYGQWRMYAGDANGGKALMDSALTYDPGLQAQSALLKSQNTITEGRSGSQPLLNGQPIGRGVPQIQQLTDPRSGQKYFAQIFPNGDVVPLRTDGAGASGSAGGGLAPGGGNGVGGIPGNGGGALPPALWTAQQYVESHFDKNAISPVGATGPAQFTPQTAAMYGGNGTQAQQRYMAALYGKYGSMPLALAAYNWGPGNVDTWLKPQNQGGAGGDPQQLPAETQTYINKVLDLTGKAGGFGTGNISGAFNTGGNSGSQFASSANPGSNPGAGLLVSELGPAQQASMAERGKVLEDTVGTQIDTDANAAKQQNFLLDQLKSESQGWAAGMGPLAPHIADWQKWAQQIFPDAPELAKSVGNYQSFNKNAMEIVRVQVRNTSSRASTQEFQMIQQTLPGAGMSRPAFNQITDQLGALNDYKLAKQQAASAWRQQHQTLEGFETDYNRNVSPGAFLLMRMSPDALKAMTANMQATAEGRTVLKRLGAEVAYGQQNGLFGNQ